VLDPHHDLGTPEQVRRHSARALLQRVRELHTLGPSATNCHRAARQWFRLRGRKGRVVLHATLEEAVAGMPRDGRAALMACIAYPRLHDLIFRNLGQLRLADCLIMPTFDMVLAARVAGGLPGSVVCHPAPQLLVPAGASEVRFTTSNAQAAADCAAGLADACITTRQAAALHSLVVLRNFGPVDMGFTVHVVASEGLP
jgi:hypothetical protein